MTELHRWTAEIDYRYGPGIKTVVRSFHELADLHDLIEAGPNFYAIAAIRIGPPRHCAPTTLTVEEASRL